MNSWHSLIPALDSTLAAMGLLVYIVVTHIRQQRRRPSVAMAWVLLILVFPYFGLPAFLMFGTRKVVRPKAPDRPAPLGPWNDAAKAPYWATRLLAALDVAGPVPAGDVKFQADGAQSLAALLALIDSAQHTLEVCTYLVGRDPVGRSIAKRLAERARAGVRVRLLVDAFGSFGALHVHDDVLLPAGVKRRTFMPMVLNPRRGHTNLRNHRKVVIADAKRLWSGGRNLASEYFTGKHGHPPWVDLSFTAAGQLALQARAIFEGDWRIAPGLRHPPRASYAQRLVRLEKRLSALPAPDADSRAANALEAIISTGASPLPATDLDSRSDAPPSPLSAILGPRPMGPLQLAQWVPNGPDCHADNLYSLLVSAITHAEDRVLITTPYFVPDEGLLNAMILAARRGVRVVLLTPKHSNHRLADLARGRSIRELIAAGGEVFLMKRMLHAKAVVTDDALALCGSANLDGRSLFINFEAMVAFYGPAQIQWLADWITQGTLGLPRARLIKPPWWRDLLEGVVSAIAFQL